MVPTLSVMVETLAAEELHPSPNTRSMPVVTKPAGHVSPHWELAVPMAPPVDRRKVMAI